MLWEIRALMKPALSVIDLIPNVHRTPALTLLRRAVLDGRPVVLRLSGDEKELAFQDTSVPLTSPIGARVLLALYHAGHLKLKKPALRSLPALEAYAATETAFTPSKRSVYSSSAASPRDFTSARICTTRCSISESAPADQCSRRCNCASKSGPSLRSRRSFSVMVGRPRRLRGSRSAGAAARA